MNQSGTFVDAGLVESFAGLVKGVESRDWVDASIGVVSVGLDALSLTIDPLGTVAAWGFSWLIEHLRPLKLALDQLAGYPSQILSDVHNWETVDYTTTSYYRMNRILRGKSADLTPEQLAEIGKEADGLSVALMKIPAREGVSYRGSRVSEADMAGYIEGKVYTERAFLSTSKEADRAFPGNTYFVISGKSGRDIQPYSAMYGEAEILFDKGTEFLITSKKWNEDMKKWVVVMKEVHS